MEGLPRLDGYRLERPLGQGGFGSVWAGVKLSTRQKVAVKLIPRTAQLNWRYFEHELRMLREVAEHPHVVTLLDARFEETSASLVMPVLAGSLHGVLWPGEADCVPRTLRWFEEIAQALDYTHRKGILHCDLKPSNVLLDEEDRVRVVDFGQALEVGGGGHALGTMGFMPPEQIEAHPLVSGGAERGPDVSWDVYALGATVYQLLTRSCPRLEEGELTTLRGMTDPLERLKLCSQLQRRQPLVPVRQLNPKVDEDLATIVESCLELDPRRRPDVAQLLADLRRRRQGHPLLCRRPWTLRYRLDRFVRKPLVALCLLTPLLLLLFVNTYLTLTAMDGIYAETFQRLRDANDSARRVLESGADPALFRSEPFRYYLVSRDGQVLRAFFQQPAPARLPLPLQGNTYTREEGSQELLGAVGEVREGVLVTELSATRTVQSLGEMRRRNLLLTMLTILVTLLLGLLAFRATGGDG